MWRLLQRPVAQGAPRLVGRPTRGSGESRGGRKCQIKSLRKINQGEGSEGGRQWRRCDWASGEQRRRSQLRQLRVRGRWGKHPLLCSGRFEIVRPLGMALVDKVRYNIIKVTDWECVFYYGFTKWCLQLMWWFFLQIALFRCKRCGTRITTPAVRWLTWIFIAWSICYHPTGKSLVRKKWSDQADETMGDYLCGQVLHSAFHFLFHVRLFVFPLGLNPWFLSQTC